MGEDKIDWEKCASLCVTKEEKGAGRSVESVETRDESKFCSPVGVIVRNVNVMRVRKETRVTCMKLRGTGETANIDVYKCHSEVALHVNRELTKTRWKKRARSMAIKITTFMKYRLNMLIRNGTVTDLTNTDVEEVVDIDEYDVRNGVDGAGDRTWTEEDCVVEIVNVPERLSADRIGRILSRKGDKTRHRTNSATSIDKFKLFK